MPDLYLPPGVVRDELSVNERVQRGDPTMGWRGDGNMVVLFEPERQVVQALGLDGQGERYVAAEVDPRAEGWQHTLLRKLRDGDWQNENRMAELVKKFTAEQKAADTADDDALGAASEKLAWGLRRDIGTYVDGLSKEHY